MKKVKKISYLAEAAENLDLTDSENACISAAIALPFGDSLSTTLKQYQDKLKNYF